MRRRTNIINTILTYIFTFGTLFAVVYTCNDRYLDAELIDVALWLALGAILAGVLNTFVHELGHLIIGKINGFAFSSMQVLFFKWERVGKKICFSFANMKYEAGYTEMIPTRTDNMALRYKRMSLGGPFASLGFSFVGIAPFFISALSFELFCLWSIFLPIGFYFHFSSILPTSSYGVRNDGGVAYGLKILDDESKVTVALLCMQAEAYNGKTPSEIDSKFYFNLPQLPEDNPVFMMLLNAQFNYYLDMGDFENAKKTIFRLDSLEEYMPKHFIQIVKADLLYAYCTFAYDEEKADDVAYEIEKSLNNINTATTVRIKLAYLLYVRREKDMADRFYKKAVKEAEKAQIKGYGAFEKKLLEKMKADF